MKQIKKNDNSEYDDDSDPKLEDYEDDRITDAWGKEKRHFYQKPREESSSEDEKEEEQEALRLQQRKAKLLKNSDFGLDSEEAENDLAEKKNVAVIKLDKELENLDVDEEDLQVEKLEKRKLDLPEEEKLKILKKESPLLLELLKEFKEKLGEIKDTLEPILQKVKISKSNKKKIYPNYFQTGKKWRTSNKQRNFLFRIEISFVVELLHQSLVLSFDEE